jgi:hypothetical protein
MATLSHRDCHTQEAGEWGDAMSEQSLEDHGTAKWIDREDTHSRQVLSTAKLVVTFSAGIAAAFVSAAMQKNDKGAWSVIAAALMAATLIVTILVLLKRKSELNLDNVAGKPPGEVQATLKVTALADKAVADCAHTLMVWQVFFSLFSSIAAAIELF